MKKKFLNYKILLAFVTTLVTTIFILAPLSRVIRADDDEGEDNRGQNNFTPPAQTQVQPQPQIIYQPVPEIIQVPAPTPVPTPPAEPEVPVPTPPVTPKPTTITVTRPLVNTALLALKDSDQDGIPDKLEKHPGQDDFAFSLIDNNHNGIADDLENLLK